MITYEVLSHALIRSAKEAGLKAYNVKSMMNTITCDREFSFLCTPEESDEPYTVRAEIDFHWDSVLTAQTVYGNNRPVFDESSASVPSDELDTDFLVELQIKYSFEADENIDKLNQELNRVFAKYMSHDNIPSIRWQLIVSNKGEQKITSIWAVHYWDINIKKDVEFNQIFREIHSVLMGLKDLSFLK
ncbi:hypothetical protein Dred_0612 [Desulforamulus reducens MI-1]|uniref:Uncharacterized protein n=1 Tax=Desulforamulus reducens (strain ATCC BAA-1160 / DSM 100696 / MI-1) TaxID=349161 RepID=A4J249_DESRM|nr:hypothetical protein [Desulforamulus reducens]ABO49152.1 hypothetical protein Dred_0612 [Desulforamulus reducens MI-1]